MKEMTMTRRTTLCLVVCGALLAGAVVAVASDDLPQRYRGRLAAMSGPAGGQTTWITLHADAWTSDDVVLRLAGILAEEGQKALMSAMSEIEPPGWVRIGDNTRYHLRVVRRLEREDGTVVIRGYTDRPVQFGEIIRSTRSRDYTLGMVELVLDAEGSGGGGIIPAAQISFTDAGTIEIESFGTQPYRIMNVAPEKLKKK
jgi:hypothetical protein